MAHLPRVMEDHLIISLILLFAIVSIEPLGVGTLPDSLKYRPSTATPCQLSCYLHETTQFTCLEQWLHTCLCAPMIIVVVLVELALWI